MKQHEKLAEMIAEEVVDFEGEDISWVNRHSLAAQSIGGWVQPEDKAEALARWLYYLGRCDEAIDGPNSEERTDALDPIISATWWIAIISVAGGHDPIDRARAESFLLEFLKSTAERL